MLGLFSLLDAMLDNSMEHLMAQLPLTDSVKNALTKRTGDMFFFLQAIEQYEVGDWFGFDKTTNVIGLDHEKVTDFYLDAVCWADSFQ